MRHHLKYILLINLFFAFVGAVWAFSYVNEKVEASYITAFGQCMDMPKDTSAEAQSCYAKGGCYAQLCSLTGSGPKPKISLMEFLSLAKMVITKNVPEEPTCADYCLMPAEK